MAIYLGRKKIGNSLLVALEDDLDTELTEQETLVNKLEADVNGLKELDNSAINLQIYKYQDLSRVISTGGEFATDEAYESAENYLQGLYTLIMGG